MSELAITVTCQSCYFSSSVSKGGALYPPPPVSSHDNHVAVLNRWNVPLEWNGGMEKWNGHILGISDGWRERKLP